MLCPGCTLAAQFYGWQDACAALCSLWAAGELERQWKHRLVP